MGNAQNLQGMTYVKMILCIAQEKSISWVNYILRYIKWGIAFPTVYCVIF